MWAATTREVYNIAKSVTARIDVSQNGQQIGRGSGFTCAGGEVLINAQRRRSGERGDYSVAYNAYTNKGMSGSEVFDRQGRVPDQIDVAISLPDPGRYLLPIEQNFMCGWLTRSSKEITIGSWRFYTFNKLPNSTNKMAI